MTADYQAGARFGAYVLRRRLGGGGFGDVWLAEDASGNEYALKLLSGKYSAGDAPRLRADVELLAAAASADSPHVVRVYGGGMEPAPHVVMEYIRGTDLDREIDRLGSLPVERTIAIGRAVAEALETLRQRGIIHRDVKPGNVMLTTDDVVKLTDFGIAKIVGMETVTVASKVPMSMAYAAPEAWEGHATYASDLYAYGAMLFQCLAGRPPFTGSFAEVFRAHLMAAPDLTLLPEATPPTLRKLIEACLAKEPSQRPAGGDAIAGMLDASEAELRSARQPTVVVPTTPGVEPRRFGPWLRRAPHPSIPWSYFCVHESTGREATVDVHFVDDIEFGARLRQAVAGQEAMTPEQRVLLGSSRLILRPGEAWTEPPAGRFQFWLARRELEPAELTPAEPPPPATPRQPPAASATDATVVVTPLRQDPDATVYARQAPAQPIKMRLARAWRDEFLLEFVNSGSAATLALHFQAAGAEGLTGTLNHTLPESVQVPANSSAKITFRVRLDGGIPSDLRPRGFNVRGEVKEGGGGAADPAPVSGAYMPIPISARQPGR